MTLPEFYFLIIFHVSIENIYGYALIFTLETENVCYKNAPRSSPSSFTIPSLECWSSARALLASAAPQPIRKRQRTLCAALEAGAVTLAETREMQRSHPISPRSNCKRYFRGTSLAVQSLKLHVSNVGEVGSIPGQGTKIAHAMRCRKKNYLIAIMYVQVHSTAAKKKKIQVVRITYRRHFFLWGPLISSRGYQKAYLHFLLFPALTSKFPFNYRRLNKCPDTCGFQTRNLCPWPQATLLPTPVHTSCDVTH